MLPLPLFAFLFLGMWLLAILPLSKYMNQEDAPFLFSIGAAGILAATAAFFYIVQREPFEMTTMDYVMRDVKVLGATALSMFTMSGLFYRVVRQHAKSEAKKEV